MRAVPVLLLFALLAAGCTSPGSVHDDPVSRQAVQGGAGGGGGAVTNSAPTVTSFVSDRTSGQNDGAFTVVFTGSTFDRNTENQVVTLAVSATGPAAISSTHAVTPSERLTTGEPGPFGPDGWKVWTDKANDGVLHWKHRHTFALFSPAGDYSFRAEATDRPGAVGASSPVVVTLQRFSLVRVSEAPVDAAGLPLSGATWGGWTAEGGATGVAATNYLKLVNDGDRADATVVIDFTESAFRGAEDANFSVPIDGNVRFAWFEDKTPAATSPAEGTFTFGAPGPDGAVTVSFTGKGHVIYVTYRLDKLPDVLPVQSYASTFTVTEL